MGVCRATSRKQANQQHVKEVEHRHNVLDAFAATPQAAQAEGRRTYATACMRASATSAHALAATSERVLLPLLADAAWVEHPGTAVSERARSSTDTIRGWDPALQLLPHRLREFVLRKSVACDAAYSASDLPALSFSEINVHKHCVLAADYDCVHGVAGQTVVITP